MTSTGTWRPLLDGELAEEAWQAILEVATALEEPPPGESSTERAVPERVLEPAGLGGGTSGLALFFSYLAEARGDNGYAGVAASYLDQAIDGLAQSPMGPELYNGFTGVGWAADHLDGRASEAEDEEDATQELDEMLARLLRHRPWRGHYDLISGLAGFAVYALEGASRPTARTCLELVVARLDELAEGRDGGVTWLTPPQHLPQWQREIAPRGYYNLGVAHGVPAVIAVLAAICAAGLVPHRSRPLLDKAVEWLLAQALEADAGLPPWNAPGALRAPARLAWCYGDPGVAAALLAAARCVGRQDWERQALRIALRAARRLPEDSRIHDAGLCHGAAGLGHLFNRLFQATGEEALGAAAVSCFQQALGMRRPGAGVAGFLAYYPQPDGEDLWTPDRGFLTGAAGIALALLGAVSPLEPEWDRVLLLSIPPGTR